MGRRHLKENSGKKRITVEKPHFSFKQGFWRILGFQIPRLLKFSAAVGGGATDRPSSPASVSGGCTCSRILVPGVFLLPDPRVREKHRGASSLEDDTLSAPWCAARAPAPGALILGFAAPCSARRFQLGRSRANAHHLTLTTGLILL